MHLGMVECHVLLTGHCDLASDLVSRMIMSETDLLYYLRQESQIWCVNASWDGGVSSLVFESL